MKLRSGRETNPQDAIASEANAALNNARRGVTGAAVRYRNRNRNRYQNRITPMSTNSQSRVSNAGIENTASAALQELNTLTATVRRRGRRAKPRRSRTPRVDPDPIPDDNTSLNEFNMSFINEYLDHEVDATSNQIDEIINFFNDWPQSENDESEHNDSEDL